MPQRDLLLPWRDALGNAALALECQGVARGRGARGGPRRCSSASAWPSSSARARPSCRAGCASGWRSCARCCPGRPVLLLDEPFGALDAITRARHAGVAGRRARAPSRARSCWSPTTSRRRSSWPTAWRCCRRARAAWWPSFDVDLRRGRAAVTDPRVRRRCEARALEALRHEARSRWRSACWSACSWLAWQGVASLDSVDDLTLASPVETLDALRDDRVAAARQRLASRSSRCCWAWRIVGRGAACGSRSAMHLLRAAARRRLPAAGRPRRRSRSWCSRRSSCSPSTTASARSSRSSR